MEVHFKISREDAMAAAVAAFVRDYPQQYDILKEMEIVPAFDTDANFDGFLVSGFIQKKGTVS